MPGKRETIREEGTALRAARYEILPRFGSVPAWVFVCAEEVER